MPEYEIFRVLWWALLGILLIGIAVMDGFDMGTAILLPIVGRTDLERRVVINTIGPVWEGNQVWLVLGAGAIFAAFPPLYGVAFSGFYLAMLLLLFSLILRPVGFKFRSKLTATRWRTTWDTALFVGGLVPALVFGVAFGNVLQGVPFSFDYMLRMTYTGSLLGLFNPFALLCGLVSVAMLVMHGASYLGCKTEGVVRDRARFAGTVAGAVVIALFVLGGIWASTINGYILSSFPGVAAPSNPIGKIVARHAGALLANYTAAPLTLAAPLVGIIGATAAIFILRSGKRALLAFVCSGLSIAGIIATAGFALFPFMLPSSLDPNASLTLWDASSSQTTLIIMTFATAVFLPLIIAYTSWIYHVLRGPVTAEQITRDTHSAY